MELYKVLYKELSLKIDLWGTPDNFLYNILSTPSLLSPNAGFPIISYIYGGVLFYSLRAEYAAPNIEQGMLTRYADFVRLSFQLCSKIRKIVKIVVCRLGMPTRYADWVCQLGMPTAGG